MNTTPEENASIHRLTDAEYRATFVSPMRRVEEEEEIVVMDLTAYAEECLKALRLAVTLDDVEIPYFWLSADRRFTHVPLFYGAPNAIVVIVLDNDTHTIPGYYPLNLNIAYGLASP